jgi:hypothetical protein
MNNFLITNSNSSDEIDTLPLSTVDKDITINTDTKESETDDVIENESSSVSFGERLCYRWMNALIVRYV